MMMDSKEIENGSSLESEVVIIGGGVAGIALARQLSQLGHEVAILESGGEQPDNQTQSLYSGSATIGAHGTGNRSIDDYLVSSRLRYFGGSGNHWAGVCAPLDSGDFEQRDWIPYSGWPVTRRQLQPFYDRACDFLEIPRFDRDFNFPQEAGRPPLNINNAQRITSRPHFITQYTGGIHKGPYDALKDRTANHHRVRVYLNANVIRIALDDEQHVKEVQIACLNGRQHCARAKVYILATGGIENVRLLLASNDIQNTGIGNQTDWLGRCFQGHASIRDRSFFSWNRDSTIFLIHPAGSMSLYSYDKNFYFVLGTTIEAQREARSTNFSVYFRGAAETQPSAKAILGLAPRLSQSESKIGSHYLARFAIEHTPNRESRITLIPDDLDDLGMPRVRLKWRNSELDFEGFDRSIALLVKELGMHNGGRVQWYDKFDKTPTYLRHGARHHMGATRMSRSPKNGVVNERCQIHGVKNLYVAGSSVFPTSGIANPTLTILALTFRLGDHLHSTLQV